MAADRLQVLKDMLAQDPSNAFAHYGDAMEYVRQNRLEEGAREFESLMSANPSYVPAYFHAGQTLEKLGRIDDARSVYERGIDTATRSGDAHTRSELQAALDML